MQDHVLRSLNLDLSLGSAPRKPLRRRGSRRRQGAPTTSSSAPPEPAQGVHEPLVWAGDDDGGGGTGGGAAPLRRRAVRSVNRIQQRIERDRIRMHRLAGGTPTSSRPSASGSRGGAGATGSPGAPLPERTGAQSQLDTAPDLDWSQEDWACTKCTLVNAGRVNTCVACGSARPDVGGDVRSITLAQKRGLVARPAAKLSRKDWEGIAAKAGEREEHIGDCAICMEPFGLGEQVLLSCSHMFHRQCLESFERFVTVTVAVCVPCLSLFPA